MPNDDKHNNLFARKIRQAFRKSGMSIKRLSDKAGVPYAAVHGFINGTKDPLLSTTVKLCRVLELTLIGKDS